MVIHLKQWKLEMMMNIILFQLKKMMLCYSNKIPQLEEAFKEYGNELICFIVEPLLQRLVGC